MDAMTDRRRSVGRLVCGLLFTISGGCLGEIEPDGDLAPDPEVQPPGPIATDDSNLVSEVSGLVASDKSRWPRVAPVLFVHGAGSSPATWGVEPQREGRAVLFPSDDDSKTGQWFWHKSELANLHKCPSLMITPLTGPSTGFREVFPSTGANRCLISNPAAEAILGGPGPVQQKRLIFAANTEFGSSSSAFDATLAEVYDQVQAKVTRRSRNLVLGFDGTFGHKNADGSGALYGTSTFTGYPARTDAAALPKTFQSATDPRDVVGLAQRGNGVEVYDAFWGNGWPDGIVPKEMSGPDGMIYGYYLDKLAGTQGGKCAGCPPGTPSPARYVRTITYRTTDYFPSSTPNLEDKELTTKGQYLGFNGRGFRGDNVGIVEYLTYTPEEFAALPEVGSRAADPNLVKSTLVKGITGRWGNSASIFNGCGTVVKCRYIFRKTTDPKFTADPFGKSTTYIHEMIAEDTGANFHLRVQYDDRHDAYDGRQFVEETPDGQVGQLYRAAVRVLDKYYVDAAGAPNWRRGGDSDPDAQLVLVGHSQGGVLARALLYPGFGARGQYDSGQGFQPMYWPASDETNGQAPVDLRKHVAGVVTTSSPHYGAQIGFPLEGFMKMHEGMVAQRKGGGGFYVTAFDGKLLDSLTTAGQAIIDSVNFSATEPTATAVATEAALAGLRDLQRNASLRTYKMFEMLQGAGIQNVTQGLAFWKNDGIANPCGGNGRLAGTRNMNYYRLFWQPEYDNWARSFRRGSISGVTERYNQLTTHNDYFDFSQRLCEEQVGHFTYVEDGLGSVNDPLSARWKFPPPLPKEAAIPPAGDLVRDMKVPPGLETARNNFAKCIDALYSEDEMFILGGMAVLGDLMPAWVRLPIHLLVGGAVASEIASGFDTINRCVEKLKVDVTNAAHEAYFPHSTAAAQGLAYHPASAWLHRLNQKGGPSLWDEKRPYPIRPDGRPIPFINVINRVSPNNLEQVSTRAMHGDTAVQTLAMDMGFGYPEMAKAGSLTKIAFTGYIHTEATGMKPATLGPYCTIDPANPGAGCVVDASKNMQMLVDNRRAFANLVLGLATGQSPVLPNAGLAFAKPEAIAAQYTTKDTAGHMIQKNDRAPVTGDVTRLKGLQLEDILEPLPLPFDRVGRRFLVEGAVVVRAGQELYLPPGAPVLFAANASLTVESGGRLTVGGAPAFAVTDDAAAVRVTTTSDGALPITLKAGAQIRFPDTARGLLRGALKRVVRSPTGALVTQDVPLNPAVIGNVPPVDAGKPSSPYYAKYDVKPYLTRVTTGDTRLVPVVPPYPFPPACDGTDGQWSGCRGNGCSVCTESVVGFSRYFANHPGCAQNTTCAGQFYTCNASCPAPTAADRDPAPSCDGSPGQWDGCRGSGCWVCAEKLVGYPRYLLNHPACLQNTTCAGEFYTCNAACPAPGPADR
jgi:hypothetical protein